MKSRAKRELLGRVRAVGITWYRVQDYDRLKAMFPDGDKLPATFEEWLKTAQEVSATLTANGLEVLKAYIDPDTFPEWCRAKGMVMNAKARVLFGNECAARYLNAKDAVIKPERRE